MGSVVAEEVKGVPVVHLCGAFDTRDTQTFRNYVFDLADQLQDGRMVIDLADLNNANSGVLRVLVLVQRKLSLLNGRLVVSGVNGSVREVFALAQVDNLLEISPCTASAVSRLEKAA